MGIMLLYLAVQPVPSETEQEKETLRTTKKPSNVAKVTQYNITLSTYKAQVGHLFREGVK